MTTFADLGAPFPLFEADVIHAVEYLADRKCSICNNQAHVCFNLGIGCALIVGCPVCGEQNGLDASENDETKCRKCGLTIPFPANEDEIVACYDCLRAGRAAITKDTELGMISWEQAFEGLTHGRPGLKRSDFELVPTNSDWVRVRLPQSIMSELLRTPSYSTIQGDDWKFCCKLPMIYVGEWSRDEFNRHAPDADGKAFFHRIVCDTVPGLWEDRLHDTTGIYVFRCQTCSSLKAHWDLA